MSDDIIHQAYGQPLPGGNPGQDPRGEAKNDMLAWTAFLLGWFWPLGLILGHSSNRSARRANRRRSILTIIGLVSAYFTLSITVIAIVAGIAGGASSAPAVQPQVTPSSASAAPAISATQEPTITPAQTAPGQNHSQPPPPAPAMTVTQQQALASAKSYLSDGQGFSRAGLIKQLTSPYGEKFARTDAIWAVDHSGADWNDQAVISAKSYLSDGQGFSRQGLIDQLTSQYGEEFTLAQATYAANHVGL